MHPSRRLIALLLFGSGMTSLIYQTAWQRLFRLVFGASTAASAAVLAIFLGGLGLGSLLLSKRAERSDRPLMLYGNLEIGVALCAAASPLLVELCSSAYVALGGSARLGGAGATLVRLFLSALAVGPSVVLMGGTLPAAARAVEGEADSARSRLALIYATNTLGAVAGALLSTFLLFELLGTRLTLWGAVLINLLVALVARGVGRDTEALPAPERGPDPAVFAAPPSSAPLARPLIYAAAGIVGFAFSCAELVWYRTLSPLLGGSSFTFGLILAVALFGIGAGGYLYSRRRQDQQATARLFVVTIFMEALAIAAPFVLGDALALYAAHTRGLGSLGFGALVVSWSVVAGVVILPAALVAGYQFPVIFALLGRGRAEVAKHVGVAYACNTLGAIAGALLGGFVLIPGLGALDTWRLLVVLLLGLGLVTLGHGLVAGPRSRWQSQAPSALLALAACLCITARGPGELWRHGGVGAGRSRVEQDDRNELIARQRELRRGLLWERDGVESSVGMTVSDGIGFVVNGKVDGSVVMDRGTQAMLGLLPAALHPQPRTVFVLGLGTGMSAGWVASVPGVERVDVAELEPAVIDVARAAAHANQRVLERPNVHLFEGDGREFLQTTERTYDLLLSEPSNPYRAGIASLFTRDFYVMAEQRLAPGGIFAQWIQGYEIDIETLRVVLRTLREVFPSVEIWHTQSSDLLLLGTRRPLTHDVPSIRRRLAAEPFLSALPRMWLVEGAEGLFSHFLAPDGLTRSIGAAFDSPINTDDDTVLEYAFARQLGIRTGEISSQFFELTARLGQERPDLVGDLDWELVRELRGRAWLMTRELSPALPGLSPQARSRARSIQLGCLGRFAEAQELWSSAPKHPPTEGSGRREGPVPKPAGAPPTASPAAAVLEPRDVVEVFVLGNGYAHQGDERALPLAARLESRDFRLEARLVRGRLFAAKRQPREAVDELLAALGELRSGSLALCNTAAEVLRLLPSLVRNQPELARRALASVMAGPLAAYQSELVRTRVAQEIAFELKDPQLCVAALGSELEEPPWEQAFLLARVDCLERAQHPLLPRAEADLRLFLSNTPGHLADGVTLGEQPGLQSRATP